MLHHGRMIRNPGDIPHAVGGKHQGLAACVQVLQVADDRPAGERIQPGGGLIQQQDGGVEREDGSQRHAALFAAAERPGETVLIGIEIQPHRVHRPAHPFTQRSLQLQLFRPVGDLVAHVLLEELHLGVLEDQPGQPAELAHAHRGVVQVEMHQPAPSPAGV